ncbi:MAG TPA: M28 family peptidase [Myxococcota bacterium]|nr:M28 family peptidase [Myxococcota bacterium]
MAQLGWKSLVAGWPWFEGSGRYPISAYSEFMPPPRLGLAPYGEANPFLFREDDPAGWHVTEYEEAFELRPGLSRIAELVMESMVHLANGRAAHGISRAKLLHNPYWPEPLAKRKGQLSHERFVLLLSLSLARTLDDKGRVRWTLFGSSEQGPARAFWKSFFEAPGVELPEERALRVLRGLLAAAFALPETQLTDLRGAGLRILPLRAPAAFPYWDEEPLPRWTRRLLFDEGEPLQGLRYLLTFRPFSELSPPLQSAYLKGELHLLPFPGSLAFWGAPPYQTLQRELPFALQIPLLHLVGRHEAPNGLRVPQSGWLHEVTAAHARADANHGPLRDGFTRTHRWARVQRHQDELALGTREDKMTHVLFSALPDELGLYGKPMARNAQVWSTDFHSILDGPAARSTELAAAIAAVKQGGLFGYRFQYPAMQLGHHAVYWQRPLVAYLDPHTQRASLLPENLLGYLTAYDTRELRLSDPVELWPRVLQREPHLAAVQLRTEGKGRSPRQESLNARKLLDAPQLLGKSPLPRSFARSLLSAPKHESLDQWLDALQGRSGAPETGRRLASELRAMITSRPDPLASPLTYGKTARRSFEVAYWKTIADLAEGRFLTKNNADCVLDSPTQKHLRHHHRDLNPLGSYLLDHYCSLVRAAGMTGRALVGDLPFKWKTDFDYAWMGGWLHNQQGETTERNLILAIPGRDRSQAVIMADHYDTAFMEDRYEPAQGGDRARLAAAGADDNHSATAALMLGAPIFLALSREGLLGCDVWLIHLTGEEFPADCLGSRQLCQSLVEGDLRLRLSDGAVHDLSKTRARGIYILDMIAHNNERDRDIFQMAPGTGPGSMWLAYQAHVATEVWNEGTRKWNRRSSRRRLGRARRSKVSKNIPPIAQHLALHGEVRPTYDPRSTLFNTDGQIFSDAGVPVVLFMENYDINRVGYHDSHDTMANIDLDFGAALAAIAIESVARAAIERPPERPAWWTRTERARPRRT